MYVQYIKTISSSKWQSKVTVVSHRTSYLRDVTCIFNSGLSRWITGQRIVCVYVQLSATTKFKLFLPYFSMISTSEVSTATNTELLPLNSHFFQLWSPPLPPRTELLDIDITGFILCARCHSCHSTVNVKAMKVQR